MDPLTAKFGIPIDQETDYVSYFSHTICRDCEYIDMTRHWGSDAKYQEKIITLKKMFHMGRIYHTHSIVIRSPIIKMKPLIFDFVIQTTRVVFVVEIWNKQQSDYHFDCDMKKMRNMGSRFKPTPVKFIRLHIGEYVMGGVTFDHPLRSRFKSLIYVINKNIRKRVAHYPLSIGYMYFDGFTGCVLFSKV